MFEWFEKINLGGAIEVIRDRFSSSDIPNWIVYNLPDFLWVFSFTSVILIIWDMKISKENIAYLFIPMGFGFVSEIGQFFSLVSGTFDKMDLLFYLIGGLTSIFIISNIKTKHNEKTITSLN